MKISQNVAWIGNVNRVVALRLGAPTGPLVLSGYAASFWMALATQAQPPGGDATSEAITNEIVDTLEELGLIER